MQSAVSSLKQELRDSAVSHTASLESLHNKDSVLLSGSRPGSRQRQVRISEVVTNNDGTMTSLKHSSPPAASQPIRDDLQGRIDAYNRALGPDSYRTQLAASDSEDEHLQDAKATYINETGDSTTHPTQDKDVSYDGNYRNMSAIPMTGSYRPGDGTQVRRHSTPRKTSSNS